MKKLNLQSSRRNFLATAGAAAALVALPVSHALARPIPVDEPYTLDTTRPLFQADNDHDSEEISIYLKDHDSRITKALASHDEQRMTHYRDAYPNPDNAKERRFLYDADGRGLIGCSPEFFCPWQDGVVARVISLWNVAIRPDLLDDLYRTSRSYSPTHRRQPGLQLSREASDTKIPEGFRNDVLRYKDVRLVRLAGAKFNRTNQSVEARFLQLYISRIETPGGHLILYGDI